MRQLLLWLVGVDGAVLNRCGRMERARLTALAGTLLMTAALSRVSMGFALRLGLQADWAVVGGGAVLWGWAS